MIPRAIIFLRRKYSRIFLWKVLFSFGNNDVTIAVFESHRSLWFRKAFWLFLLLTGWRHWVSMNYKINSWKERGYVRSQNCFCWWLSTVSHWGTSGTWVTISKSIVIIMFQVKRLKMTPASLTYTIYARPKFRPRIYTIYSWRVSKFRILEVNMLISLWISQMQLILTKTYSSWFTIDSWSVMHRCVIE